MITIIATNAFSNWIGIAFGLFDRHTKHYESSLARGDMPAMKLHREEEREH